MGGVGLSAAKEQFRQAETPLDHRPTVIHNVLHASRSKMITS